MAGKSTLNRLETFGVGTRKNQKNKKICYSEEQIDEFFVDVFLKSYRRVPAEIILDLDVTDDPLHGHQQGRFFHGYYDCYCYLPLYVFCGDRLLQVSEAFWGLLAARRRCRRKMRAGPIPSAAGPTAINGLSRPTSP